jgi:hypothetical protein
MCGGALCPLRGVLSSPYEDRLCAPRVVDVVEDRNVSAVGHFLFLVTALDMTRPASLQPLDRWRARWDETGHWREVLVVSSVLAASDDSDRWHATKPSENRRNRLHERVNVDGLDKMSAESRLLAAQHIFLLSVTAQGNTSEGMAAPSQLLHEVDAASIRQA